MKHVKTILAKYDIIILVKLHFFKNNLLECIWRHSNTHDKVSFFSLKSLTMLFYWLSQTSSTNFLSVYKQRTKLTIYNIKLWPLVHAFIIKILRKVDVEHLESESDKLLLVTRICRKEMYDYLKVALVFHTRLNMLLSYNIRLRKMRHG